MIISKEITTKKLGNLGVVLACNPRDGFTPPQSVGFSELLSDTTPPLDDFFILSDLWYNPGTFHPTWTVPPDTKTIKVFLHTQGGVGGVARYNCLNQCCLVDEPFTGTCTAGDGCGCDPIPGNDDSCENRICQNEGEECGNSQCATCDGDTPCPGTCWSPPECVPCRCANYVDCNEGLVDGFDVVAAPGSNNSTLLYHGGPLFDSRYFLGENFIPPHWHWEMLGRKLWDPTKGGPLFVSGDRDDFTFTTLGGLAHSRGFSYGAPGEEVIVFARGTDGISDSTCNFCDFGNIPCGSGCNGKAGIGLVLTYTLGNNFCTEDTVQISIAPSQSPIGRPKYQVILKVTDEDGATHEIFEENTTYGGTVTNNFEICTFDCSQCRWECPSCDEATEAYWRSLWWEENEAGEIVRNSTEAEGDVLTGNVYSKFGQEQYPQDSSIHVTNGTTRTVTRTGGAVTRFGNSTVQGPAGEETGLNTSTAWFAMNDTTVAGASAAAGNTAANTNLLDGDYGIYGTGTRVFNGTIPDGDGDPVEITGPCQCPPPDSTLIAGPGFALITAN